MVRRVLPPQFRRRICSSVLTLCLSLFLSGCAATKVTRDRIFRPVPEDGIVYIVPFLSTLVPDSFSETVFNTFVDHLNGNLADTGVRWFYIVKEDPKEIDPAWLANQAYITGDIWSYVEEPGCCSAELRLKARLRLYEPGKPAPSLEAYIPMESFFDYDHSTIEAERHLLALRLADEMASQLIKAMTAPH
jgi:hypothetical protein